MAGKPPTSVDVARLAGVSQATVSYVLNDRPDSRVSEETQARVREAAEQLGYVRHGGARSLKTGNSGLVVLPMPDVPLGPLATSLLEELDRELSKLGYVLVTYGARQARGLAAARAWAELRPAAVIAEAERLNRAAVDLLRSAGVKAVIGIDRRPSKLVPTLVTDHHGIGALAAEHLGRIGRRNLLAIVPREDGLREIGIERCEGFAKGRRVDLAFDADEAASLMDIWHKADGVFAYNDEYAMLLMAVLADAGIRVPQDIAVVGADDLPLAGLLRPRLTTVRLDISGTPAALAELVHKLVRGEKAEHTVQLWSAHLVVRDSA